MGKQKGRKQNTTQEKAFCIQTQTLI